MNPKVTIKAHFFPTDEAGSSFAEAVQKAMNRLALPNFETVISAGSGIAVRKNGNETEIVCEKPNQVFPALCCLKLHADEQSFFEKTDKPFDLQFMVDCSRNAAMNVSSFKRLIDILALLGYDALILYMEDMFEIGFDEYFGHMRGRYSADELREIVAYAGNYGMNVIPAVQTLAHLNQYFKWRGSEDLRDCADILLCGSEKTYAFIESVVSVLSSVFPYEKIMIGMDEAHSLGSGRYAALFGKRDKKDIFFEHLDRVAHILEKYGKVGMMWSDSMFVALGISYFDGDLDVKIDEQSARRLPRNIETIYWNYGQENEEVYYKKLLQHRPFGTPVHNASSTVGPGNLAPMNDLALRYLKPSVAASERAGVKSFNLYHWGDDGAELSVFAVMPSICYAAAYCYRFDFENLFKEICGVSFGDFMLLDRINKPYVDQNKFDNNIAEYFKNVGKYQLYNDILLGLCDANTEDCYAESYAETARRLRAVNGGEFQYIFDTYIALCDLLAEKSTAGKDLKRLYDAKDKDNLKAICPRLEKIVNLIGIFTEKFTSQWLKDNKALGLEVFQIKAGGLLARAKFALERVKSYVSGEMDILEELEEPRLPFDKNFDKNNPEIPFALYADIVTANKLT